MIRKNETMGKIELENSVERMANVTDFYNKKFMEVVSYHMDHLFFGKVVGYKDVRVPRYLMVPVPVIERHYDYSDMGVDFEGILLSFRWVRLFRIGTKVIKEPVYRKPKSQLIKFRRYSNLNVDTEIHPLTKD